MAKNYRENKTGTIQKSLNVKRRATEDIWNYLLLLTLIQRRNLLIREVSWRGVHPHLVEGVITGVDANIQRRFSIFLTKEDLSP